MDHTLLNHLLALAAKTGDRLIVIDPATSKPFVLMSVPQYEHMVIRNALAVSDVRSDTSPSDTAPTMSVGSMMPARPAMPIMEGLDLGALARETERMEASAGVTGFVPEPTTAALPDDERFYVEPLE